MKHLSEDDLIRCAEIKYNAPGMRIAAIRSIADEVSEQTGIPESDILGNCRMAKIAEARQICYYVAFQRGYAKREIGIAFGRDHTTIMHGIKAEEKRRGE